MKKLILIMLSVLLFGCDKGITPDPEVTGFSGTIIFSGEWPDSVQRTHLVVFRDPLNSPQDFNIFNLSFVGAAIPYGTGVYNYNSADTSLIGITAGEYSYVAVAQSKTPELSLIRSDWYVVGVYYTGNDTLPGKLVIPENILVSGIDIYCDFNNPPPQPPGGK